MPSPGRHVSELLRKAGVELHDGLSADEVHAVEHRFGFVFLPEHREFLRLHLPTGNGWPDWRAGESSRLEGPLAWPVEGASPASPAPSPAPVVSICQTDVIYFGNDLADYIEQEFGVTKLWTAQPAVRIPIWSDLAEGAWNANL